ncbi:arylsulfatase A [Aspergillus steynii IBT 23096]|uniref:Arylsulfatase A n=1 Tax=Aspergillus steynii IBT 23096 TaxID=1392250 RepID=A0A2I2FS24_9EURO|nr:arylsulfatase A [Aspergillus steynii IBT 23096]PLB43434.1 arylsulfatase A [Aspergillus steynii IBT 23096]
MTETKLPHPPQPSSDERPKKPNLLIFMPDQLRYDSLGCTSSPSNPDPVYTPNINAFSQRGTLFTNAFVQASVCSQSRCSMFTGRYPHVTGHRSLDNLIKPWEPNLFRSLKEDGYHVACLAPRGDTFSPGVTELSVTEYGFLETPDFVPKFAGNRSQSAKEKGDIWGRLFYKGLRNASEAKDYDDAVVRSALSWLDCPPDDQPWVLFLPLIFPHCPFQVEEPFFSMYDRSQMSPPSSHKDKTGHEPRYMQAIREQYGTHRATGEMWKELKAVYYGMISRLDHQFGQIIDKVDSLGLWDTTVTMFFTDHGEYLGDHGLIEKWPSGLSDSLVHEPLIIAGGGLPKNQVYSGMVEMVDVLPTILELCSVRETFPHNGLSLLPALQDPKKKHKQFAFSEGGFLLTEEPLLEQAPYPYDIKSALQHTDTSLVGKAVSLRSPEWTYVYRLYEAAELYSRADDPGELNNLAAHPDYVPLVRMFEAEVLRWLVQTSDFLPWEKDPRFPDVDLESPREQLKRRLEKKERKTAE